MVEYSYPGVYIEEVEREPRSIEGVPTSTAAFLGETERGPLYPLLVTSFREYVRWFGGACERNTCMTLAINGFFENGGGRAYIARIVGRGAQVAFREFGDLHVEALGPGGCAKTAVYVAVDDGTTRTAQGPIGFRVRIWVCDEPPPDGKPFPPFRPGANQERLPRPSRMENFDDLTFDPDAPGYFATRIELLELANEGIELVA